MSAKEELLAALVAASAEPGVRAVVLGSRGRAFCVGQDLRELRDGLREPDTPDLGEVVRRYYNPIVADHRRYAQARHRGHQRRRRRCRTRHRAGL